ncbi:MAG: ABC transporter substrate-binding protein [Chloroflexota bacterium]
MRRLVLLVVVVLLALTTGCRQGPPSEKALVRFGTLPRVFDLPLYVAEQGGFFQDQGIEVELVPFNSVMERDVALVAGQIDGTLDDLFSAILLNKGKEERVRVVATVPLDQPMIVIVASAQSSIASVAELKGVEIAVSINTVMDYALDRMLTAQGFQPDQIQRSNIASMSIRLQMLKLGKVKAAVLTPPLSDVAILNGGRAVIDDGANIGVPNLLFTSHTVEDKPETVRRFVRAWEKAVEAINRTPQEYRQLLTEVAQVPAETSENLRIPVFAGLGLPSEPELESRVDWMLAQGILERRISYQQMVEPGFLP